MEATDTKTRGERALDWINEGIAAGRTVYVITYTRATAVTPKTAARWAKSSRELFRIRNGNLQMSQGNSYVNLTLGELLLVGLNAA